MLIVQLVLISSDIELENLDQYYIGIYAIGITAIPLTNVIQTFHSKSLGSKYEILENERNDIAFDCMSAIGFSILFLILLLTYLDMQFTKNIIMIIMFSIISVLSILGAQYNLYQRKYFFSQLLPLVLAILLLLNAFYKENINLMYVFAYAVLAYLIVLLIYIRNMNILIKNFYQIQWQKLSTVNILASLKRLFSVIIQICPTFYIIIVSSVLANNHVGYASFYGFYYSFIGFFSVILGQNLLSVILAEKTFHNVSISKNVSKIFFKTCFALLVILITLEIIRFLLGNAILFFDIESIEYKYLEFLHRFYYAIFCCALFLLSGIFFVPISYQ